MFPRVVCAYDLDVYLYMNSPSAGSQVHCFGLCLASVGIAQPSV